MQKNRHISSALLYLISSNTAQVPAEHELPSQPSSIMASLIS